MARRPRTPIILDDDDDDDDRPSRRERERNDRSRDGFEMGLASAILGATFLVLGMLAPMLIMTVARPHFGDFYSTRGDGLPEVLLFFGLVGVGVICVVGIILGSRGISRSRAAKTNTALPLAGVLMNLAAIFLWLLVAWFVLAGI